MRRKENRSDREKVEYTELKKTAKEAQTKITKVAEDQNKYIKDQRQSFVE